MKKEVFLFSILIILLMFILPFAIADINVSDSDDEQSKIDKAYTCLEEKVQDKCSSLSLEEQIFSLLAIKECKDEVVSDSKNDECWPESSCDIKSTAQAILALDRVNTNTDEAETWLLSQNKTPENIVWYLEIESPELTTCTITYSGSSYAITIGTDKKISSGAGSCLSLAQDDYWLKISSSCYDKEFEISCEKQFLTTLLFKKETSSTIHVSEKATSASAGGTTTEKINSFCFEQGGSCNYEGSLWAALVLNFKGYKVSSYLPYLVTMKDEIENTKYLPESFLYSLTGYTDIRNSLLLKQKSSKWWLESDDKFYDTALALYPLQYEETQEKTNSINWLLDVQDNNGCWEGNTRDTAFILYSLWPKDISSGDFDDGIDCEDAGYNCMSSINCQEGGGNVLNYDCSGVFVCCDKEKTLEECVDQGGEICDSAQNCVGGTTVDASDSDYGETCCVGGSCEEPSQVSECESYGGVCETSSCDKNEEEVSYTCDSGQTCCVEKTTTAKKSYWWIWVLLLLIVLAVLGIIFKDRLRPIWFKIKSKFGKSKPRGPSSGRPGFPPPYSNIPQRRPMQRRILPPTQRQPVTRPAPGQKPRAKSQGEINEVLKKLKEMGK